MRGAGASGWQADLVRAGRLRASAAARRRVTISQALAPGQFRARN
jgi:hypothetical protein